MQDDRQESSGTFVELLSFSVGQQSYAIEIMAVREIRGWAKPTPLPHAPPFMRGVINLRGTVLPIIDLAARLGLEPTQVTDRNVIIVVQVNDQTVGLLVDAVSDILALDKADMQPPPEMNTSSDGGFIEALTIVDERMIRILDLRALLPAEDEEAA